MRALVCEAYGPIENLKIKDIPTPEPRAGEVLVRVGAAGVSFAAMLGVQGKHQNKPALPYVPGNEIAGHVVALGEGVTNLKVGQRIATGGSQGGFAEYAVTIAANAVPIPEIMPYAEATNFPTLYPTAYGALKWKANLQPGEVLLVHGAGGGSGLTGIEVGKAMGATVIASAGGADKLRLARRHGADHLIDHRSEDLRERIKALTGGRGADVVFDPVGGPAFEASLRATAPDGRIVVVGFASGQVPQIPANIVLVKNLSVIGLYWGAYRDIRPEAFARQFEVLFKWWEEGALKPHTSHTFPLAEAGAAFAALLSRQSTGKVALIMEAP